MNKEIMPDYTIATIKTKDRDFFLEIREMNNTRIASYEEILRRGFKEIKKDRIISNAT